MWNKELEERLDDISKRIGEIGLSFKHHMAFEKTLDSQKKSLREALRMMARRIVEPEGKIIRDSILQFAYSPPECEPEPSILKLVNECVFGPEPEVTNRIDAPNLFCYALRESHFASEKDHQEELKKKREAQAAKQPEKSDKIIVIVSGTAQESIKQLKDYLPEDVFEILEKQVFNDKSTMKPT